MKKFLTFVAIVSATSFVSAQQISLNSQYLFNEMLVNPGATGAKDYIPIQIAYRKQWANFPGAPVTQAITSHGKVAKKIGFGGSIFNDVAGPSRRTGMNLNAAYHLQLDKANNHRLGMGMGVSLTQHLIDVTRLSTYLPDDPAVTGGYNNQIVPDANVGIFYYFKDKGYAGLSAYNLVQVNRNLYDYQNTFSNSLVRTYYFLGGYNFTLSKNFGFKVATLVQGIETGTVQFDGTGLFTFKDYVWLGASYRHTDAVAFLIGGQIGPFKLGYSYDYTLSDIAKYSYGSHEIFLELQLYKKKDGGRTPWLKRNRIYAPKI